MLEHVVPLDWRLILAIATVILAGTAKGVTGMGLPVAGVPILVALYGDLRLVLLTTIFATAVTDIPMVWKYRASWREATFLAGFTVAGLIGIVIGTAILQIVPVAILCAVLACVVVAFIIISWTGKVPTMNRVIAQRVGPLIGLICGVFQGSAGASGPIITSYLLSSGLKREGFLFSINAIFIVLDWTQFISLQRLGLTTPAIWMAAIGVLVLASAGMAFGFFIQSRIDDKIFKRAVLVMLACAAVGLVTRALRG